LSVDSSYYVYALKDPRKSPALPFYVGKGTGTRSYDHLVKPDDSRKGILIQEIEASGQQVLVTRLVDSLTEIQALKLEAELISAFGPSTQVAFLPTRFFQAVWPQSREPQ
jgi:uncharacterized protein